MKFVAPEGFALSPVRQGGNPALDSDAGAGGLSQTVNLVSGEHNATIDAGLVRLVPAISISKLTNGSDGPVLLRDGQVAWTCAVTNTGAVALANVAVTDDRDGAIAVVSGDANSDGRLDLTETWLFRETGTASEASCTNIGTVTGDFMDGLGGTTTVMATDPSAHSTVVPSIPITKLTNRVDGLVVLRGAAVTWTIAVTNTGAIDLRDIRVADDREGAITAFTGDDGDKLLDVGETWTSSKTGVASEATYAIRADRRRASSLGGVNLH